MKYLIMGNGNPRYIWYGHERAFAHDLDGKYDWAYTTLRAARRMLRELRARFPKLDLDIIDTEQHRRKLEDGTE
jgi:hypothetical protein